MNKQNIIEHLTHHCGLQRASAIRAVEGVINSIFDAIARGEEVTLRGLATIRPVDVAQRVGRNPSTGDSIIIPAHRPAKLILSKELKTLINSNGTLV